jgi:hypothetical protein
MNAKGDTMLESKTKAACSLMLKKLKGESIFSS